MLWCCFHTATNLLSDEVEGLNLQPRRSSRQENLPASLSLALFYYRSEIPWFLTIVSFYHPVQPKILRTQTAQWKIFLTHTHRQNRLVILAIFSCSICPAGTQKSPFSSSIFKLEASKLALMCVLVCKLLNLRASRQVGLSEHQRDSRCSFLNRPRWEKCALDVSNKPKWDFFWKK